jgi:hypothetical protein
MLNFNVIEINLINNGVKIIKIKMPSRKPEVAGRHWRMG